VDRSRQVADTPLGQIVLLNGTSSSGKSRIAAELVQLLDDTYFLMAVDAFHAMRTRRDHQPEELEAALRRTRAGFHRAIAGMAAAGNNVVADHVLSERWRLDDCLAVFEGLDVVFVGVRCDLDEIARRELARRDRPIGLAAEQLEHVHADAIYDVECDTAITSARDCALQIKDFLSNPTEPSAFERLRRAPK